MNDKELRRLNRKQLLELLLLQIQRADELEGRLAEAEEKLRSREIAQMQAGSLAEAALKLSGIFEAAQEAADLYLENVQKQSGKPPVNHPKPTGKRKNAKKRSKK
ncbi:MAG: DNA repair protein [Clostridia bacterium]|nr:DNA repair protein [Clostridia bacterium]